MRGCSDQSFQEAPVPTLFRFLFVVLILAGLGFGAVFYLATMVNPTPREISVPIPSQRLPSPPSR
nr:histidine kinase [Microvirga antarctica]